MKNIVRACLWSSSVWLSAAAAAPAFDIDAALGAPYPDAPVAAERAPLIAWSANERGVRNLWAARAPEFAPRKLTVYDRDDGQTLTALQLSAGGRWLAYVRGAPSSGASGQSLNPANDADGAERALWVIATDGSGKPTSLPGARAPLFAPQGDALLFNRAGVVGCHALTDPAPAWCRETLLKLQGANAAVAFSPDGTRLLFVSDRGDRAYVGVLDLGTREVRWMAPDFNRDSAPVWSPDGKRIAFLRSAGLRNDDKFDLIAANRFEIRRADAASGRAERLFESGPDAGGYAQFAVDQPLRWTRDGLVFASEENGWLHWYALSPDGGAPRALSRGDCEAASAATPGNGALVFSGNCADIERPQLFAAEASRQRRLTRAEDDIETDPAVVAGGDWIALRHSDARLPTAIAVLPARGGEVRRIFPAKLPDDFPQAALVEPKTLTLRAADGVVSHAQLFEPKHGDKRRPAIVYVHGGPIRQMLPGWMPVDYYAHDYANNQWLAAQGYVVLSLNYRAGTGYGQAFRLAAKQGPRGMSEYQDVLAAHAYLAARPDVDPARIGIYGGSYGGYLTAQALARDSDRFAAGVDRHGVHDWRESAKGGDNSGLWGLKPGELELAWQSSPVAKLDGWRSPVLLVHGDDDSAVKFAQTTDLAARLRERGVPIETLVLPGEEHMFLRHASWLEVYRRSADFFRRQLVEGKRR
ncbi:prolyl oligopeptidase family serine peptidase [Dokdonella sp.]|uniref:S9 family peptidase n=1 Tax=Dokdonella sp. TaxID=2291710 RepID=UPI001B071D92|nr:prolyl oligopeptidase family serine peptidase [Dokdonella sp.]MBO9661415.1 S9 family peptidase [Dokdonella sp.]